MRFPQPLVTGRLERRYKRFLADVLLDDGRRVTAACPNTGTMLGLTAPGSPVWLSPALSKTRKLPFTWELIAEPDGTLVGINTGWPNRLAREAIEAGTIPELAGYAEIKAEQRYDEASRIDLLLRSEGRPPCYVEVKNVHLRRQAGLAEFPDCVTTRGAKHLAALARQVAAGARAVMLFVVQRGDCGRFGLAADLDPGYKAAFDEARAGGVECLVWDCEVGPEGIALRRPLPLLK